MSTLSIQSQIIGGQGSGLKLSYGSLTTLAAAMIAFTALSSFWSEAVGDILREALDWDKRSTLTKIFILIMLLFIFVMLTVICDKYFFNRSN